MKLNTFITRSDHEFMLFDVRGTTETLKRETAVEYEVDFHLPGMKLTSTVRLLSAEVEDLTPKQIQHLIQNKFIQAIEESGAITDDPED